jgi:hypothetical protein
LFSYDPSCYLGSFQPSDVFGTARIILINLQIALLDTYTLQAMTREIKVLLYLLLRVTISMKAFESILWKSYRDFVTGVL